MAVMPRLNLRWKAQSIDDFDRWTEYSGAAGGFARAGTYVNEDAAMTLSAVWACLRILSGTMASLPLPVLRRLPVGGNERAPDHHLYRLLHSQANPEMTAFECREIGMTSLLLWGNAYFFKEHNRGNQVIGLYPIHPARVEVSRKTMGGPLSYKVKNADASFQTYSARNIMHIRLMSADGVTGRSVVNLACEDYGLALAEREYGARWFGQGAHPAGIIEYQAGMSPEGRENFKVEVAKKYAGLGKSHGLMVLEQGLKFHQITIPPEDSQFLQSRKFSLNEVSRWFGVPPHLVGDLERSTNNNIEEQNRDFVRYQVREHCTRWERVIHASLFPPEDQEEYFAEFVIDGLLRGDPKARAEMLAMMHDRAALNSDEWRRMENMNPMPDGLGTVFLAPVNKAPLDKIISGEVKSDPNAKAPPDVEGSRVADFRLLLQREAARLIRREANEVPALVRRALKDDPAALESRVTDWYEEHLGHAHSQLGPVVRAAGASLGVTVLGTHSFLERHIGLQKGGVFGCLNQPDPLAALHNHFAARRETWPGELTDAILAELEV